MKIEFSDGKYVLASQCCKTAQEWTIHFSQMYKHSNGHIIMFTITKSIIFIPIVPISNGCCLALFFL